MSTACVLCGKCDKLFCVFDKPQNKIVLRMCGKTLSDVISSNNLFSYHMIKNETAKICESCFHINMRWYLYKQNVARNIDKDLTVMDKVLERYPILKNVDLNPKVVLRRQNLDDFDNSAKSPKKSENQNETSKKLEYQNETPKKLENQNETPKKLENQNETSKKLENQNETSKSLENQNEIPKKSCNLENKNESPGNCKNNTCENLTFAIVYNANNSTNPDSIPKLTLKNITNTASDNNQDDSEKFLNELNLCKTDSTKTARHPGRLKRKSTENNEVTNKKPCLEVHDDPSEIKQTNSNEPLLKLKSNQSLFICDACNGLLYNAKDLKNHRRKHMRCNLCKKSFRTMEDTKNHCENLCEIKNIMNNLPSVKLVQVELIHSIREKYPKAFSDLDHQLVNNVDTLVKSKNINPVSTSSVNIISNQVITSTTSARQVSKKLKINNIICISDDEDQSVELTIEENNESESKNKDLEMNLDIQVLNHSKSIALTKNSVSGYKKLPSAVVIKNPIVQTKELGTQNLQSALPAPVTELIATKCKTQITSPEIIRPDIQITDCDTSLIYSAESDIDLLKKLLKGGCERAMQTKMPCNSDINFTFAKDHIFQINGLMKELDYFNVLLNISYSPLYSAKYAYKGASANAEVSTVKQKAPKGIVLISQIRTLPVENKPNNATSNAIKKNADIFNNTDFVEAIKNRIDNLMTANMVSVNETMVNITKARSILPKSPLINPTVSNAEASHIPNNSKSVPAVRTKIKQANKLYNLEDAKTSAQSTTLNNTTSSLATHSSSLLKNSFVSSKPNVSKVPLNYTAQISDNLNVSHPQNFNNLNVSHSQNLINQNVGHPQNVNNLNVNLSQNVIKQNVGNPQNVSNQNVSHSQNVIKHNVGSTQNVNNPNASHSQNVIKQNVGHPQNVNNLNVNLLQNVGNPQNVSHSQNVIKHNVGSTQNVNNPNVSHSQNVGHPPNVHNLNVSHPHNINNLNVSHSQNVNNLNVSHWQNGIKQNVAHPQNVNNLNASHLQNGIKQNVGHPQNVNILNVSNPQIEIKQNVDHPQNVNILNVSHPQNGIKQNVGHPQNVNNPNVSHPKNGIKQNVDHLQNVNKFNFSHPHNVNNLNVNQTQSITNFHINEQKNAHVLLGKPLQKVPNFNSTLNHPIGIQPAASQFVPRLRVKSVNELK